MNRTAPTLTRIIHYAALIFAGAAGLFVGDYLGPLTGFVGDYDLGHQGVPIGYRETIGGFHKILVGACATLPILVLGRLFEVRSIPVVLIALILATVFSFLPLARVGEVPSIYEFVRLPVTLAPYAVGICASFGFVFIVDESLRALTARTRP